MKTLGKRLPIQGYFGHPTKNKDFGLADAFILAQRSKKQKIVTGDPHFREIGNTEFLK